MGAKNPTTVWQPWGFCRNSLYSRQAPTASLTTTTSRTTCRIFPNIGGECIRGSAPSQAKKEWDDRPGVSGSIWRKSLVRAAEKAMDLGGLRSINIESLA